MLTFFSVSSVMTISMSGDELAEGISIDMVALAVGMSMLTSGEENMGVGLADLKWMAAGA